MPRPYPLPITRPLRPPVYPQGPEDLFSKRSFNALNIFISLGFRDNVCFFKDIVHGLDINAYGSMNIGDERLN